MGSFMLDFSGYNSLLYSNGQSTSYYGPDDAYIGGGDPGFAPLPGRRNLHHHHHHPNHNHPNHNHPNHPNHQTGAAGANNNVTQTRQINNRFIVQDRNSLPRFEAEKTYQDRRKQQIANFGATWLKPPGLPKTLFQLREECREQEEQAEQERRDELAQQLARAEAAAAEERGEGATANGDTTGEPGGATDLMDNREADAAAAAAGLDAEMLEDGQEGETGLEEEEEIDLDGEVPDADGADFSFGNNNDDSDDPFASSGDESEDESEEEEEEDEEEAEAGEGDEDDGDAGLANTSMASMVSAGDTSGGVGASQSFSTPVNTSRTPKPQQRQRGGVAAATPVRSIEEQREQARARAAERREMRQMRAAEDRMRAMRAHPRLSSMGMGMGMNMYGEEDDLDEEDQAQMLQEDDLVRDPPPSLQRQQQQEQQRRQQQQEDHHHRQHRQQYHYDQSGGPQSDDNAGEGYYHQYGSDDGIAYDEDGHPIHDDDLEMDMDADLDGDIPEGSSALGGLDGRHSTGGDGALDLSSEAFEGGYEHTDTEAELSSSVVGAGDHIGRSGARHEDDGDVGLPPHNFLTPASGPPALGHRRFQRSTGRSNNNSLDISSLLSGDGSSNIGSSPHARHR